LWRHQATCQHCGQKSNWNQNGEVSVQEIFTNLRQSHQITAPLIYNDYQIERQRQCDSCLEPYVDNCIKCRQDFYRFHAGDIDGLCGSCI
jgi:hypothetical protein